VVERRAAVRPFFSVCIPQHNRTSFLIEVCRSLSAQQFDAFEVCISDDCSTDGREAELLAYLASSPLAYVYRRLERNGRYDVNLRAAIDLAAGDYCFLLGNDDVLKSPQTLARLHAEMAKAPRARVVFTNFEDYASGRVTARVRQTAVVGRGPEVAARSFRKFSFVSGVVLHQASAKALSSTKWDGSEMYQMYIGCQMIAAGGDVLEVDQVATRKDLQLPDEQVDSYARRTRTVLKGIPSQQIPLVQLPGLVIDALLPSIGAGRLRVVLNVLVQFFGFLYPFWLLEYRRVQSWRYAAGVARAIWPASSLARVPLTWTERRLAGLLYGAATLAGFMVPLWLLDVVYPPARRLGQWVGERAVTAPAQEARAD
jgi:glycosyltransferase involved in cell wall biosynthesis